MYVPVMCVGTIEELILVDKGDDDLAKLLSELADDWVNHQEPDEISRFSISVDQEKGILTYIEETVDRYEPGNPVVLNKAECIIPLGKIDPSCTSVAACCLQIQATGGERVFKFRTLHPSSGSEADFASFSLRLSQKYFEMPESDQRVHRLKQAVHNIVLQYRA